MANPRKKLADRAARSHGVFTRREAYEAGLTRHEIDHDLKSGRYDLIYEGVYAHDGAPKSLEMYQAAACKWAGDLAAVSHRSALEEYGLADLKAEAIEVTTASRRCKKAPFILHRTTYLPKHHIRVRGGRPVTDVARALFDSGAVLPQRIVTRATEEAVRRNLTTLKELLGRLVEHGGRGRRGCGSLRRAVLALDPLLEKTDSALEGLMLRRVWNGDLPRPAVQYHVKVNGKKYRLDFAYPDLKINIEGDGFDKHGLHDGFEGDRDRDAELESAGWLVLRFTWRQVRDRPEWVIEKIKQATELRTTLFFGS